MSWAAQIDSLKTELQARMAVLRTQVLDLIGAMESEMSEQLDLLLAEARQREQASSRDASDEQGAVEDLLMAGTGGTAGQSSSTDAVQFLVSLSQWRYPVVNNDVTIDGALLRLDPARTHQVHVVKSAAGLSPCLLAGSYLYRVRSELEQPEEVDLGTELPTHTCQLSGERFVEVQGWGVFPLQ